MHDQPNGWEKVPNTPGFYRRKRDYGYAYRFRMPGERTWTANTDGLELTEAKRWRAKLLGGPKHTRVAHSNMTFLEFVTDWIAASATTGPRSKRQYQGAIANYMKPLHRLKLHEIGPDTIRFAITEMQEHGLSANTIKAALVPAGAAMASAKARGYIASNPFLDLEKRDRPRKSDKAIRILKPEELRHLLDEAEDDLRPLVATLFLAGLRISEAVGLVWADVDFDENRIHVRRQLATCQSDVSIGDYWCPLKGEGASGKIKARDVEMCATLRSFLTAHRDPRGVEPDQFVFVTKDGEHQSANNVQRRFAKLATKAGFTEPRLTPHQGRHTFATYLIKDGADVGFVADQLGHTAMVTLTTYRKQLSDQRSSGRAAAALDGAFSKALLA